jgi:hypothetical protein
MRYKEEEDKFEITAADIPNLDDPYRVSEPVIPVPQHGT